ncbi:MAG: alpha/beta hydrolase [Lactobacillaceae bacterium]|jgi:fermentation-respiration switch protein FrsA (DUF1100 family)|nr:alpha/beta hydrolase [Lactobacillaceae bacterium]
MVKQKRKWSLTRKIITVLISVLLVFTIAVAGVSYYFFTVAEVRADKAFISGKSIAKGQPLYAEQQTWLHYPTQTWNLTAKDGTKLVGNYVAATKKTNKTVIVIHGFGVDHVAMAPYGTMFHEMGYNVLMPDNRAAGKSGGKYIGFGYLEAKDYLEWINQVIARNGQQSQIVVMGASLGGATTMTLSGMNPPKQVKAYIEDAGYSSTYDELYHEAADLYGIPLPIAKPIVHVVSWYSNLIAGYSYEQATAVNYLQHNTRPMMFIHGAKDDFVPTKFVYRNYKATKGPKTLYVVPRAAHVASYATNYQQYEQKVAKFLNQYFH